MEELISATLLSEEAKRTAPLKSSSSSLTETLSSHELSGVMTMGAA